MPRHSTPPTPMPIATWNAARGVWETDQASLYCEHSERYSVTWPTSGMTRSGTAYPPPTSAHRTSGSGCSFSPCDLPMSDGCSTLLPTPRASDGTKGGPNQRGSSGDLMLPSAVARLLPTPTTSDTNGIGAHGTGGTDLRTAVSLLPTPQARDGRDNSPTLPSPTTAHARMTQGKRVLEDAIALLPTPTARDWKGTNQRQDTTCLPGALLPTPTAADADRTSTRYVRGNPTLLGATTPTTDATTSTTRPPSTGVSTPTLFDAGNE